MPDVSTFVEKNAKRNANPRSSMHSLELVITVIFFVLVGRFLDSQLDTLPWMTIAFGALGFVGSFLSAYYRYQAVSKKEDEGKVWTRDTVQETPEIAKEPSDELIIPEGYGSND